jgi:[ribosomal protein S5]-alanine N-acetyltransferase
VSKTCAVGDQVRLRPIEEHDLTHLVRLLWDPEAPGEYQWSASASTRSEASNAAGATTGSSARTPRSWRSNSKMAPARGWVTWRAVAGSTNFEIGIALFPGHRGHGVGTQAQRQLVSYLFDTTTANRLQAGTELDNVAEQRSLERVGFRREGVQRGLYFRAGAWRDSVMYGLLRAEWLSGATEE